MIAEAIGSAASTPSIVALEPSRAHRRTTHSGQITIGPAPPTHPFPRFPPLEVFERRPSAPEFAAPCVIGRHPKTFTTSDMLK
jgi:hypothetical protein